MMDSFSKHKQHSHHYKSHMMMPGTPFPHLIIGHAAFAFTVFKYPFNPVSLPLHPPQTAKRCLLRGIGQGNLCVRIGPKRLGGDQSPASCTIRFPVPYINGQTADPNLKRSACRIAKCYRFPAPGRNRTYNISHFNALFIRPILLKLPATPRL